MTERKDKWLYIRFKNNPIRFPSRCPICLEPATKKGTISTRVYRRDVGYVQKTSRYHNRRSLKERRSIDIPVCETHYKVLERERKLLPAYVLFTAIFFSALVFLFASIAFHIYDGLHVDITHLVLFMTSLILSIFGLYTLGPNILEKAIKIRRYDYSSREIVLGVKERQYFDEILHLNKPEAKKVIFQKRSSHA